MIESQLNLLYERGEGSKDLIELARFHQELDHDIDVHFPT